MKKKLKAQSEFSEEQKAIKDRVYPDQAGFQALSGKYDMAVVGITAPCDLETPISAFIKLRGEEPCFLLESAERGERWGRYSFLGFDPMRLFRSINGTLLVSNGSFEREIPGDPVRNLFDEVEGARVFLPVEGVPFSGGAVGYFGYDILPYIEKASLKGAASEIPELMFMVPRRIVLFDHLMSRIHVGVLVEVPRGPEECADRHREAMSEIAEMLTSLRSPLPHGLGVVMDEPALADFEGVDSNMSRECYEEMVSRSRDYIYEGDAFQIVVSQKFSVPFEADPLAVYRFLRYENPSTYMFYLQLPSVCLVGASPEPMVTNRAGRAVTRPIAGTRPRGADDEQDRQLADELLEDPKEKAEHIMLVDLARNDLGRVCRAGTVKVTSLLQVERYSHVMHLVSQVEGQLREGTGNYELLKASFPAGTVSGAPKVRACQIIDELEPDRRGPYSGAVGYLSYSGDMDTCIAIRTVVIENGRATVQAGAGIVADSEPSQEWEESRNKARSIIRAVKAAGG